MFDLKDKFEAITFVVAFVIYILNEFRKWNARRKEKSKFKSGLDFDAAIHSTIDNVLWQMLSIYRCSRVFVMQFHNGDSYYTGQSRIRVTITNEVVYPGVRKMSQDYNGVQVSENLHKLMRDIKVTGFVYTPSIDLVTEEQLSDVMKVLEIKSFIMIRLTDNKKNETVALLILHFPYNYPLDKIQIGTLMMSKKRLETIFGRL